jgi:hypothetical protein
VLPSGAGARRCGTAVYQASPGSWRRLPAGLRGCGPTRRPRAPHGGRPVLHERLRALRGHGGTHARLCAPDGAAHACGRGRGSWRGSGVRRDRGGRRARGDRGRRGRGADRRARRAGAAEPGHDRAHAVQPGDRGPWQVATRVRAARPGRRRWVAWPTPRRSTVACSTPRRGRRSVRCGAERAGRVRGGRARRWSRGRPRGGPSCGARWRALDVTDGDGSAARDRRAAGRRAVVGGAERRAVHRDLPPRGRVVRAPQPRGGPAGRGAGAPPVGSLGRRGTA